MPPSFFKPFLSRLTVLCAPSDLLMDTAAHLRSALTPLFPPFPRGPGSHWAVSSSGSSPWTRSRRRLHHLPGVPSLSSPPAAPCSPLLRALRAFHKGGPTPCRRERIPTPNTNVHDLTSAALPQQWKKEQVYLVPLTLHKHGQG